MNRPPEPDAGPLPPSRDPGGGRPAPDSITACIVCRNEADRLEVCLPTVGWVDEVLVMDLASSDGSGDVARRFGARVLERAPVPVVEWVRNELADAASSEWILVVDPDERITPGLAAELRRVARLPGIDAVDLPRMNFDLGYPPTAPLHRYERQLRMYRRSAVRWPRTPNALPRVPSSRVHFVPARDELVLRHDRNRTIPEAIERALRYAPAQAQSMVDRGEVFTARAMIGALAAVAYKQFLRGEALHDGVPGVLRAGILLSYHFYVWAAFWQLSGARRTSDDDRLLRRLAPLLGGVRRALRLGRAVTRAPSALLRRR